jgi:hypothetical protein
MVELSTTYAASTITLYAMAPTTRGRKKREVKSAEFIAEEDDFLVDDEASGTGSEDYNDNGYAHFNVKAFVINLMFRSEMEVDLEEEEEEEEEEERRRRERRRRKWKWWQRRRKRPSAYALFHFLALFNNSSQRVSN